MNTGCAIYFVIGMVILFIASLAAIPEGGIYGVGFTALIGYFIYQLIIKPIIEESKKKPDKPAGSGSSTYTQARSGSTGNYRSTGSGSSSDKDDLLDAGIAAGMIYYMMSGDSDYSYNDDDDDKDDWDEDDDLFMYENDHDFDDDDWDDW